MDILFTPDYAPNVHPLLVHFPIAILILAAIANFVTLLISK